MTDEMKKKEEGRFIVIGHRHNDIVSEAISEDAAKAQAEKCAEEKPDEAFGVYQRIGIAKVEPKVTWKATR